jgi:hypothetical protein
MRRSYAAAYLALLLLLSVPSHGQDTVESRDTLAGLAGVAIEVVPTAPQLDERGMTAYVIEAEVERRLKEAGIPVLQPDAPELVPGLQTLYVEVLGIVDEYSDQCTWSVRVEVDQAVRLERNPDTIPFLSPTWSATGLGYQTKEWRKGIINDVLAYTDRFIEAFTAANPQEISP